MIQAQKLVSQFLSNACPDLAGRPFRHIRADEVEAMLFAQLPMFRAEAERLGMAWSSEGVVDVDRMLANIAEVGMFEGGITLSPAGACEMYRRWHYSLIAAAFERQHMTDFVILAPDEAQLEAQAVVVMLTMLSGVGREYPEHLFPRHAGN